MLSTTTVERLRSFNIPGFTQALLVHGQQASALTFEDRLTLLVDAEYTRRLNAKAARMLQQARIPSSASVEEVDFSVPRSLNKGVFLEVLNGQWLSSGQNIIVTGPTGVGKTFLSSVITRTLCLNGFHARFQRTHHWCAELLLLEEKRRIKQAVAGLRKVPLLVFDEWLRDPVTPAEARLLLDLIDDRYRRLSCMFISQFPVSAWHARFQDPTLADALLDRILAHALRFDLQGDSLRKLPLIELKKETSLRSEKP